MNKESIYFYNSMNLNVYCKYIVCFWGKLDKLIDFKVILELGKATK